MNLAEKSHRMSKITVELLRLAATGAAFYIAAGSPIGARKIDQMIGRSLTRQMRHYIQKRIGELERDRVIFLGGEKIVLTDKGKQLLERIGNSEITIHPSKWDGIWRLVAYDIPDTKRQHRNAFRNQIEKLGFMQVQESLFCLPYECKEEIAVLAQQCLVSPYVIFMRTDDLPQAKKLKAHFALSI